MWGQTKHSTIQLRDKKTDSKHELQSMQSTKTKMKPFNLQTLSTVQQRPPITPWPTLISPQPLAKSTERPTPEAPKSQKVGKKLQKHSHIHNSKPRNTSESNCSALRRSYLRCLGFRNCQFFFEVWRSSHKLEKFWGHGRAAPAIVEVPQEKKIGEKN